MLWLTSINTSTRFLYCVSTARLSVLYKFEYSKLLKLQADLIYFLQACAIPQPRAKGCTSQPNRGRSFYQARGKAQDHVVSLRNPRSLQRSLLLTRKWKSGVSFPSGSLTRTTCVVSAANILKTRVPEDKGQNNGELGVPTMPA